MAQVDRTKAASPRLGRALVSLGNVGIAFGLLLYVTDIMYSAARGQKLLELPLSAFGLWTIGIVLAGLAVRGVHWGRRMQVPPAPELLKDDQRAPILYLRSFQDDPVTHSVFDGFFTRLNYRTEEEELAATFMDVGPMVAVGQPGETLPALGAARYYFTDAEWRDRVGELMASSQLVLLRIGGSRGLAWELARTVRTLTPDKLVLVVGDGVSFVEFLRVIEKPMAERLAKLEISGGVGSMRGFITFGPDFEPRYVPLRRSWLRWTFTHPYLYELRTALRPLFQARGFPFSVPPFPILRNIVILCLTAVMLYLEFSR